MEKGEDVLRDRPGGDGARGCAGVLSTVAAGAVDSAVGDVGLSPTRVLPAAAPPVSLLCARSVLGAERCLGLVSSRLTALNDSGAFG